MSKDSEDLPPLPRMNKVIFINIYHDNRVLMGKIVAMDSWGACIKVLGELPVKESIIINFIYHMEYNISCNIRGKNDSGEYLLEFIFYDMTHRETLHRHLHEDKLKNTAQ